MKSRQSESGGLYDAILEQLFERLDAGTEPTVGEAKAASPGHEETAELAFAAFQRYRRLKASMPRPAPIAEALPAGERLGDFEILAPIARGGMSMVYRARQLSLGGREVALKVLPREGAPLHGERRFQREALALAGHHHPHLAEVYGFGEEHGLFFLAMQLVEGPNLGDVVVRLATHHDLLAAPQVRRRIVRWIAQVADACALVHRSGLVHRDVKPSNIVVEGARAEDALDADHPAVLVDFGLVRPVDPEAATLTGGTPATPSYAPPEQLLGREVDARADVFSIGVTLHDLLAGRTPAERLQASVGLESLEDLVPGIGRDLAAVVAKAVDPDPRWRYPHAGALRDDLLAWLAGRPVSARRSPWHERTRRWVARHPGRLAGGVLALLGLGALALAGLAVRNLAEARGLARKAWEEGDAAALAKSAERVPSILDGVVFGPRVAALARRARSARGLDAPPKDSAGRLFWHRARQDEAAALLAAATDLRLVPEGGAPDPFVSRYLLTAFERVFEPARGDAGSDSRAVLLAARDAGLRAELAELASVLVARIFYERPGRDRAELEWSRPFRDACKRFWLDPPVQREPGASRENQLYTLAALSGCGEADDLLWLADIAVGFQHEEEGRLAFRAMESIARRAHALRTTQEIPYEELWRVYGPALRFVQESSGGWYLDLPTYDLRTAVERMHRALLFAESRSRPAGARPFCAEWLAARSPESTPGEKWFLPFRIAARDPEVIALVLDPPPALASAGGGEPKDLGLACAVFQNDLDPARVRERWRDRLAAENAAAEFESALASREHEGLLPEHEPDEETRLGHPESNREWQALDSRPDLSRSLVDVVVVARSEAGAPRAELPGRAATAWWDFTSEEPCHGGTASPAEALDARMKNEQHGTHYLCLSRFGRSAVRLPFGLDAPPGKHAFLLLDHVSPARAYLPRFGKVHLEILLNGEALASRALVPEQDDARALVQLPRTRLVAGRNEVQIRLRETTTTTYWLISAFVILP